MKFFKKTYFLMALLGLLVSGASWAIFTPQGSLWVLQKALVHALGVPRVVFGASSGSFWSGLDLRHVELKGFRIADVEGSAMIDQAEIALTLSQGLPQVSLKADSITLQWPGAFDHATVKNLRFDNSTLTLDQIVIHHLKKISGENETVLERCSIRLPVDKDDGITATGVTFRSLMGLMTAAEVSGGVSKLILKDFEIKESPFLPNHGSVEIQAVAVSAPFDWNQIISVENGRLRPSGSDTILFYGTQDAGQLDFHVYSKHAELGSIFSAIQPLRGVSASVSDVDISIQGPLKDVRIQGTASLDRVAYRRFVLTNCRPVSLNLNLKTLSKGYELFGEVTVNGGEISHKNIRLILEPGKIFFSGSPEDPSFGLKASTKISETSIHIQLDGSLVKPDLSLSSKPSYPQEKILVMLVTGKEWTGSEEALRKGKVSADAAKEFIDYFVLGGSGEKLAARFGIKAVLLTMDESSQGIELKKSLSKKIDLGYGVEKKRSEKQTGAVAQKVGVDYKVSADTLISIEGKLTPASAKPNDADSPETAAAKGVAISMKKKF